MLASELVARVLTLTDDGGDHTSPEVLAILNRGVLEIAGGFPSGWEYERLAPLPDLHSTDTVTLLAGESSVSLPAEFHRQLDLVVDPDGVELSKYDSHIKFLKKYPLLDESGDPTCCSSKGGTLYCQPSPATDRVLTLYFYRLPVDMTIVTSPAADDEPDGIPVHLQDKLLVNYACMHIFTGIEQGDDGKRPNTDLHTARFIQAVTDLSRFVGQTDGEAFNVEESEEDYIL